MPVYSTGRFQYTGSYSTKYNTCQFILKVDSSIQAAILLNKIPASLFYRQIPGYSLTGRYSTKYNTCQFILQVDSSIQAAIILHAIPASLFYRQILIYRHLFYYIQFLTVYVRQICLYRDRSFFLLWAALKVLLKNYTS